MSYIGCLERSYSRQGCLTGTVLSISNTSEEDTWGRCGYVLFQNGTFNSLKHLFCGKSQIRARIHEFEGLNDLRAVPPTDRFCCYGNGVI
jgi:hypothetical protein